jgi:hypothetical protein
VSIDGDDAMALANDGATPFRNLQPAIDFAAANPAIAEGVCVGLGAYDGPEDEPLVMRNGVSVTGGYDPENWLRLDGFVSRIRQHAAEGVLFSHEIDAETVLDGFIVAPPELDPPHHDTTTGVIVDGAREVVLINVFIELLSDSDFPPRPRSYGVDVRNGGDVTIRSSRIVAQCVTECFALRSSSGRVVFLDGEIDVGNPHDSDDIEAAGVYGIAELVDAPGSRIEASELHLRAPSNPLCELRGITLTGDSEGTVVAGNSLAHDLRLVPAGAGITFTECGGASPSIVDNVLDAVQIGIVTGPGCPALIDGNTVNMVGAPNTRIVGIECQDGCTVLNNGVLGVNDASFIQGPGAVNEAVGVVCADCVTVHGNDIVALTRIGCTRNCDFGSVGLRLSGNGTLVDSNTITAGCSAGQTGGGGSIGVLAGGAHRLVNNVISGGFDCGTSHELQTIAVSHGVHASGPVDIHSNLIDAGETRNSVCKGSAILLGGGGTLIRNNALRPTNCHQGATVEETSANSDPAVLENNAFAPGVPPVLYIDIGGPDPRSIAEVNGLQDIVSSANFVAECFPLSEASACVDAGTPTGAPAHDRNGNPRIAKPDVGPEEWGDLP